MSEPDINYFKKEEKKATETEPETEKRQANKPNIY